MLTTLGQLEGRVAMKQHFLAAVFLAAVEGWGKSYWDVQNDLNRTRVAKNALAVSYAGQAFVVKLESSPFLRSLLMAFVGKTQKCLWQLEMEPVFYHTFLFYPALYLRLFWKTDNKIDSMKNFYLKFHLFYKLGTKFCLG